MRTAILLTPALSLFLSLFATSSLVGCSGAESSDVNAGTSAQELKKNKDGSATGNGKVCFWDSGSVSVSPSDPDYPVSNEPVSSPPSSGSAPGSHGGGDQSEPDQGEKYQSPMPTVDAEPVPVSTQTQYPIGASFPAPDGCNTCACTAQGVLCTAKACAPGGTSPGNPGQPPTQPPAPGCTLNGKHYKSGDSVPSVDGCNSCGCHEGQIACTEMACVDDEPKGNGK